MKKNELEHILRAAGGISECREIIVLGSQAILGSFPNAPVELLVSLEADVYPLDDPDKANLIDGCIGELSPFHQTFGYYAHGVGPETAMLPDNWRKRLVRLENNDTAGIVGLCLSPEDLAVAKLLAGREKDFEYVRVMLRNKLASVDAIESLGRELTPENAVLLAARLLRCL